MPGSIAIWLKRAGRIFERDLLNVAIYIPEDFYVVIPWLADDRFDTRDLVTDIFFRSAKRQRLSNARSKMTLLKSCCICRRLYFSSVDVVVFCKQLCI
ncbi:hypothetical protein Y888_17170 [Mixta calida B021323]|nr:hypothetical protein Y888_17170 [Mixta calida B021323]ORM62301.1 hypothetical protein HA40_03635 [Mixta calida]